MKRTSLLLISALLSGCTAGSGIGKPPVQANPLPRLARDVKIRMNELSTMLDQFDADLRDLPGRNDLEDQRAIAKLFGDLGEILPTLVGPNPNGAFREQIQIIETIRAQLVAKSVNLSAEPTEDTGIRAAYHALAAVQRDQFFDRPEIAKTLVNLQVKIDSLDTVRGPMHRMNAKDSLSLIGATIRQMSDVLNTRLANRT